MTTKRTSIPAATDAALWALSNGRCYFPGCDEPIVKETRPGTYKKNVRIAHIYGVAENSPRHRLLPAGEDRNSFKYLMLLCTPHHDEIDDRLNGEKLYPAAADVLGALDLRQSASSLARTVEMLADMDLAHQTRMLQQAANELRGGGLI